MDRETWNARYEGNELLWRAAPNQFVAAETQSLRAGRALDLACGEGRNAVWLAEQGWDVTAVDFSPVGLDKARRLAHGRGVDIDWVEADVVSYTPERAAFDLVLVVYLHLPATQRQAVFAHAAAATAPAGMLLVVGHDRENLDRGHGGPQDRSILLDAETVAGELTGHGLVVDRAERVERVVDTDGGPCTALDTLVRARRPT